MVSLIHFVHVPQDPALAGSTLLKVLDNFALNSHNASHSINTDSGNIGMLFTMILKTSK